MPFTLAHPAAAAPLYRAFPAHMNLAALVIGSITPDYAYFVLLPEARFYTHSLEGLFVFCLPAGLFSVWLYYRLLKPALIDLTPPGMRARLLTLRSPARLTPAPAITIVVSVLAGALTHIVWDAFTHSYGWGVGLVPELREVIATVPGYRLHWYGFLQHTGHPLGLGLLALWITRWYQGTPPLADAPPPVISQRQRRVAVAALIAIPLLGGGLYGWRAVMTISGVFGVLVFLVRATICALGLATAVILTYSAWYRMQRGAAAVSEK